MERSAFGYLSVAIAAFEFDNHSQVQDLAFLPPQTDGYASDEELGMMIYGMQGTWNLQETLLGP